MQSLMPWLLHCGLPVQRGPRKAELLVLLLLLLLLVQRLLAEEPGQARACWEWFHGAAQRVLPLATMGMLPLSRMWPCRKGWCWQACCWPSQPHPTSLGHHA